MTMAPTGLTELTATDLAAWVRRAGDLIAEHADELTELDAAIGDADHGANMKRGMEAAMAAVAAPVPGTADAVLKKAATALISKVGGASGPLYGTFFLRMAAATAGRSALDLDALTAAVEAGVGGIMQRGRAEAGEKTMLDAWLPALEALRAGTSMQAALREAAAAADAGRAATEPMLARKGRASYLGERSIGHVDPGASSTALIVRALADVADGTAS
ncbi:dihydroxyacetone kinase subunit DhaL [Actinomyces israelii]|uniref:dihydroxyacetone kinase subunit DhaL n=1 Tax=Actinomyces israelii TaxID=1659 RepID=UPI00255324D4|nr:dihydroxyacetone kinase subunit DhaL [Actinomyces israelii]WKR21730.1 PEP-dependent dihydroxyacetone kinase, ADP-binding subunit DhaL [Actinomyces israelii]